jgi:hypothetical protein
MRNNEVERWAALLLPALPVASCDCTSAALSVADTLRMHTRYGQGLAAASCSPLDCPFLSTGIGIAVSKRNSILAIHSQCRA